jgi:hypothetical protein
MIQGCPVPEQVYQTLVLKMALNPAVFILDAPGSAGIPSLPEFDDGLSSKESGTCWQGCRRFQTE